MRGGSCELGAEGRTGSSTAPARGLPSWSWHSGAERGLEGLLVLLQLEGRSEQVRHGAASGAQDGAGRAGADSVGSGGKRPVPDESSGGCRVRSCVWARTSLGARSTHLVGDAVEHLHGQVRHVGVGVSGQVQQHAPDLRVHAVEGDAWGRGDGSGAGAVSGGRATARPLLRALMERRKVPAAPSR